MSLSRELSLIDGTRGAQGLFLDSSLEGRVCSLKGYFWVGRRLCYLLFIGHGIRARVGSSLTQPAPTQGGIRHFCFLINLDERLLAVTT